MTRHHAATHADHITPAAHLLSTTPSLRVIAGGVA